MDPATDFRQVIEAAGLRPEQVLADGSLHRCGTDGKERGADGAYVLHPDPPASGWFKNYRTGHEDSWTAGSGDMSPEERKRLNRRIQRDKAARQEEEAKRRAEAREKATRILEDSKPCSADHPYLKKKGIKPVAGVRMTDDGKLVVPVLDPADNTAMSLQFIDRDGGKKFLYGGQTSGGFFAIKGEPGPLYIAEGLATAATIHEATGHTILAAFNAGNLIHVARSARIRYPEREIIIAGDDDHETEGNPGRTKAEQAGQEIKGKVILPKFKNPTGKTDFNDLAAAEGLEAVKQQLRAKPTREPFKFLGLAEILSEPRPVDWLIRDYLEGESLSVLFGEPGAMKTFVALDMGLSLASGTDWHGNKTKGRDPVLFIAGEGRAGLSKRIKAWTTFYDVDVADLHFHFFVADRPAQFLESGSCAEVEAAIEAIAQNYGNPGLLVIDTLNRNFGPGNENDTEDMTAFVAAMDKIRSRFGCAVLIIHHSGLAEKSRGRGNSALRAALDFEYRMDVKDDVRTMTATKVKDHEPQPPIHFKPVTVETGWIDPETDEDICSCVLQVTDAPAKGRSKLTGATRIALESLVECINHKARERGEKDPSKVKIHLDDWRTQAHKNGITASTSDDAKRMAFKRAVSRLMDLTLVNASNDFYWINEENEQANKSEHVRTCSATP